MRSVIHVLPHRRTGGLREVVGVVDQGLRSRGIDSTVADMDAWLHARGSRGRRVSLALARLGTDLVKEWHRRPPDCVLAHTVGAGLFVLPVARLAGVERRGIVVHASRASLGAAKTWGVRLLLWARVASDVVFVGRAAADSFEGLGNSPKASVIPNGVSFPAPAKERSPLGRRAVRAVSVGRLVSSKRTELAVSAVLLAHAPVQLSVCGDGPQLPLLKALARGRPEIVFLGEVGREQVQRELAAADIFLFPSEVEGLPLVMLEAAGSGLAVVARDSLFAREVLADAAVYVEGDDPQVWAHAIDALVDDLDRLTRLSRLALARADLFTPEKMVEGYVQFLEGGALGRSRIRDK